MRIAFNVQDEIQAKGWSEAWYEGEEVSLSMVFTRLAAMALERLTVTYAVEALSALARELKS